MWNDGGVVPRPPTMARMMAPRHVSVITLRQRRSSAACDMSSHLPSVVKRGVSFNRLTAAIDTMITNSASFAETSRP